MFLVQSHMSTLQENTEYIESYVTVIFWNIYHLLYLTVSHLICHTLCFTSLLHLFYISFTSLLHLFCISFTSLLHLFCISCASLLHLFYISFTSLLHLLCIYFTSLLSLLHLFCISFTSLLHLFLHLFYISAPDLYPTAATTVIFFKILYANNDSNILLGINTNVSKCCAIITLAIAELTWVESGKYRLKRY